MEMKIYFRNLLCIISLIFAISILFGCAPSAKYAVPAAETIYQPRDDKALIVFLRSSFIGSAISSSLFDITKGDDNLIAIIGSGDKVAYYTDPGEGQFMVIGESADFMDTLLDAGKVYYAIVIPRMGAWKARFSLYPFKQVAHEEQFQVDSPKLVEWLNACKYVTMNNEAYIWAENNAASIREKREKYLKKWAEMPDETKRWRTLLPEDGLHAPL
jgi:hypothetical protein